MGMNDDVIRRQALARDLSRRIQLASIDELRALDRMLLELERIRDGAGDRRWERRLATGAGDRDRSFHLTARTLDAVATLCRGSWHAEDATETMDGPPLFERCTECWCRAVSDDRVALIADSFAHELALEERLPEPVSRRPR